MFTYGMSGMGDFRLPEGGYGMSHSGNAKKRRRTSQSTLVSMNQPSSVSEMQQMMGDTMFANNPFDDGNAGAMAPMGGSGMMGPRGPMMGPGVPNGHMINGSMMNGSMINGSDGVMGHMGPGGPMGMGPGGPIGQNSHMVPMGPGTPMMSPNGPMGPGIPIGLKGPMGPNGSMGTMGPAGFSPNSPMGQGGPMGGPMGPNRQMGPGGSMGGPMGPPMGMGPGGPMPMSSMSGSMSMSSIPGHMSMASISSSLGPIGQMSNGNMSQGGPMGRSVPIGHGRPMGPNGLSVPLSNGVGTCNPGHGSGPGTPNIPISSMCSTLGPGMSPLSMSSEKIYPADQPMVFNPQNPNAPPLYPCGICHREVHDNDQAILCESGCNFWFHRICTGLAEAAFHYLTQEIYAEWVCDKCFSEKDVPLVKFKP